MDYQKVKNIVEGALMAAAKPLSLNQLDDLFDLADRAAQQDRPSREQIRQALSDLEAEYQNRGIELKQVGSGFRVQVRQDYEAWIGKLWQEKPPRYSRALLETLAIIAYRQPITRAEIEAIRGVNADSMVHTLLQRRLIKISGRKDVPGQPFMYRVTKQFLNHFGLRDLSELPKIDEISQALADVEMDEDEEPREIPVSAEEAEAEMNREAPSEEERVEE